MFLQDILLFLPCVFSKSNTNFPGFQGRVETPQCLVCKLGWSESVITPHVMYEDYSLMGWMLQSLLIRYLKAQTHLCHCEAD